MGLAASRAAAEAAYAACVAADADPEVAALHAAKTEIAKLPRSARERDMQLGHGIITRSIGKRNCQIVKAAFELIASQGQQNADDFRVKVSVYFLPVFEMSINPQGAPPGPKACGSYSANMSAVNSVWPGLSESQVQGLVFTPIGDDKVIATQKTVDEGDATASGHHVHTIALVEGKIASWAHAVDAAVMDSRPATEGRDTESGDDGSLAAHVNDQSAAMIPEWEPEFSCETTSPPAAATAEAAPATNASEAANSAAAAAPAVVATDATIGSSALHESQEANAAATPALAVAATDARIESDAPVVTNTAADGAGTVGSEVPAADAIGGATAAGVDTTPNIS